MCWADRARLGRLMSRTLRTSTRVNNELFSKEPGYVDHVRRNIAVRLAEQMIEQGLVTFKDYRPDDYGRDDHIVISGEVIVSGPNDVLPVALVDFGVRPGEILPSIREEIRRSTPPLKVEQPKPQWRDLIFEDE